VKSLASQPSVQSPLAENAAFMANYTTIFVKQIVSCVCVRVIATTVTLLLQDNVASEEERPR